MTASLPAEVQQVLDRFSAIEYTTVDARGRPACRPVTASYSPGDPCIDIDTAAPEDPKVALLFSDPTGSGLERAPQVLVQGTADVSAPNRVRVRPERVYVWPEGDATREPQLYDAHMEEVRSGHDEEPESPPGPLEGGQAVWDDRLEAIAEAVLSIVAPDEFPFSVRVRVAPDPSRRQVRVGAGAIGVPARPGPAHLHASGLEVRCDLELGDGGEWLLLPRHVG
jgi:hypothetical protein